MKTNPDGVISSIREEQGFTVQEGEASYRRGVCVSHLTNQLLRFQIP